MCTCKDDIHPQICSTGWMKDRLDAGQIRCRIGRMQDRMDAWQGGCRTRQMQDMTYAGHDGCRTCKMQDRMDAGQVGCSTVRMQVKCRTVRMQDSTDAGQVRCSTGRMQDRSEQDMSDGGKDICTMQLRSDAVPVRYSAWRMQYRTYAVHDEYNTGHMQCMTDAVQDRCLILKGLLSLAVGVWPLTSTCQQQPACQIDTLRMCSTQPEGWGRGGWPVSHTIS